ncbi:MAG: hypothetical protein QOK03_924, partial [Candidatus Binataceae bacterium]|nr:hypothetical protein [Candidatus Binataceae bacterium]
MKFISRLPEQLRSLIRFPVPVAVCVAAALIFNLEIAGVITIADRLESEIIFASEGAFLAALIASLWANTRQLSAFANIVASLLAATVAIVLQFSHGGVFAQDLVVLLGLALATMVAAHLRRSASVESFWFFNLQLAIAVAMGIVALIIVCGGLSLLLASCRYLFDATIKGPIYEHIWATGVTLVGPLFALAMIPADVDQPFAVAANPGLIERAVFYVLNVALAPLALVYSLMLHTYAVKIAITANMPKGEVGWLVLTFGIIGTATYMIAYPWREVGYWPVRWFIRSWFWLMVIPAFMLTLAVWQRIAQYGVTPDRYGLSMFAIWLAAMVIYFGVARGRIDLRAIPASLAMGLLLSSFGPWGAAAVSVRSQLDQFRRFLGTKNLIANERLKLDPPRLETFAGLAASNDHLRSILETLNSLDALDRIAPVFAGVEGDPFRHLSDGRLLAALGLNGTEAASQAQAVASKPDIGVESGNSIALNFDKCRYNKLIGPLWMSRQGRLDTGDPDSPAYPEIWIGGVSVSFLDSVLTAGSQNTAVSFNLAAAIKPGAPVAKSPLLVTANEGRERAMLILVGPLNFASSNREQKFEVWLLLNTHSVSAAS